MTAHEQETVLAILTAPPTNPKAELERCAADPEFWVTQYGWTYDPRITPSRIPFILFPKQREFLRWLQDRDRLQEDGLVEKSRDMGITWLCSAYALHCWLFRPGAKIGFGSRKLDLVDKRGDMDSIFEKIRYMLYSLPDWMRPRGFNRKRDDCEAKLLNPANGAAITGEGGDDIGRGGRASVYFVDESAFLVHPQLVDRALSQTTRVRIDVSTPNGPGNPFFTRRFSGTVSVFTFHWRDDPRKGAEWYARECRRLIDPVAVAQELDIDYGASIEGICIPGAWVRAAVNLDLKPSGECVAGWDVAGDQGADLNVLLFRCGPYVYDPITWSRMNTTQSSHYAVDECERARVSRLFYDCVGIGEGVKGAIAARERRPRFAVVPVNGGDRPTETLWRDGRTSRERFHNLRTELWWSLRVRFEKAFEFVTQGIQHPAEDLISIPNHPQLIADLSLPCCLARENGKTQLESKIDMRRRGVKSPDYGDALAYCFATLRSSPGSPAAGGTRPDYNAPEPGRRGGGSPVAY